MVILPVFPYLPQTDQEIADATDHFRLYLAGRAAPRVDDLQRKRTTVTLIYVAVRAPAGVH